MLCLCSITWRKCEWSNIEGHIRQEFNKLNLGWLKLCGWNILRLSYSQANPRRLCVVSGIPTENLWRILKLQAHHWDPHNLVELKMICQEKCIKSEPRCSLINYFHRRLHRWDCQRQLWTQALICGVWILLPLSISLLKHIFFFYDYEVRLFLSIKCVIL